MTEEQIEAIADAAATKAATSAVQQVLLQLGLDVSTPASTLQAQADLAAMRDLARTATDLKKKGVVTVFVVLITALLGLVWTGVKDHLR